MILIFDLDDTLYPETTYAISGFKAVAKFIHKEFGIDEVVSLEIMISTLKARRRNLAFQDLIEKLDLPRKILSKLLSVYRNHIPQIELEPEALRVFKKYKTFSKYLVTDGNKFVQARKIESLKLNEFMKKCFITHYYGLFASKPSTYCFEKIKNLEKAEWSDLVYVGDNPTKDFVNLNPLGVTTVRVKAGNYSHLKVSKKFEGKYTIPDIGKLDKVLECVYGK
jgi:putative hydrolase of the HAD superfamily